MKTSFLLDIARYFTQPLASRAPTEPRNSTVHENTIAFTLESIKDIQATVRAIDVKLNALIVVLTLPLTRLPEMTAAVGSAYNHEASHGRPYSTIIVCAIIMSAWVTAYLVAFVALFGTYNPGTNIVGRPPLDFYLGGLYRQHVLDLFFPPRRRVARRLHDYATLFRNEDNEAILSTLVFEQMKLALIRDVKSYRHRFVARVGLLALAGGAAAYVVAYYFKVIG